MSEFHHTRPETARMAAPQAPDYRLSGRSDFVTSLTDSVRDNPIAAALIGTGIMWMLMGRSTSVGDMLESRSTGYVPISRRTRSWTGTAAHAARSAGATVSDAADSAYQAVSDAAGRVGDMLTPSNRYKSDEESMGHQLSDGIESARRYGSSVMENSRQTLAEAFERQPLLLGAAGLAIGAGIAASLPVTRTERQVMGSASDYVHQQVSEAAAQAKDLAAAAAGEIKVQAQR